MKNPPTSIRQRLMRDKKMQQDIATNDITKKYLEEVRNKELARMRSQKVNEYDRVVKNVFKPKPSEQKGMELRQQISRLSHEPRERKPHANYLD
jgi:hypothetical protein